MDTNFFGERIIMVTSFYYTITNIQNKGFLIKMFSFFNEIISFGGFRCFV